MPGVAGLRGSGTGGASSTAWGPEARPTNFREMILWRDPNGMAPLTALMSKMGEQSTDDSEYKWYEQELSPIRLKVTAIATTGATALTIDTAGDYDAFDIVAGDLLLVEKLETAASAYPFEILEVAANPTASNAATVTRGAANTGANTASIVTNTFLLKVGSAFEEGDGAPKASSRKPVLMYNYTQIFKTAYNITGSAEQTHLRTGDPVQNEKKIKMFDHATALEWAFMFGSRHETTGADSLPKRYTAGLYWWLADAFDATTNPCIKIWTTTAVSQEDFLDATYRVFDYGYTGAGNERIGLCGNGFLNYLNKIILQDGATNVNYDGTIDFFGMKLQRWIIPQGTIYLRTHPLMNVNTRFTNGCFLLNPAAIKYRFLRNRDTKFKDNIQLLDADERKGMWMTDAGMEVHHLRSMMYLAIQV
jgi:hypothetical protein